MVNVNSWTIYYESADVAVTGVTLNPSTEQTISVDGSVAFTATVNPGEATDKTVKWSVGGTNSDAVKLYSDESCQTEVGSNATSTLTVYAKGISAGSATVTVTSNSDSNKSASSNVTVHAHDFTYSASGATITATCGAAGCDLTDSKATLTIVKPTLETYLQTGAGISPAATLTGPEAFKTATGLTVTADSIKYFKATKSGSTYTKDGTALAAAPTYAGDFIAEITLTGVKTGADATGDVAASVGYTIAKAEITITTAPAAGEITYGQTLEDSTLTGGVVSEKDDSRVSVEGTFAWKDSTVVPTVSDSQKTEYDVVFMPKNTNYATAECKVKLTVNKADSAVTKAPTAKTLTYTGSSQALVSAGTAEGGTMQYALGTATEATGTYSADIPTATNAGTYYVWYKAAATDENHNDSVPAYVTANIAPAAVTLTANSGEETYDGTEKAVNGFTASVKGLTFAETVVASGSGTNAGEYEIKFSGVTVGETKDSTGNYVVTEVKPGKLTISKHAATVTANAQTVQVGGAIATDVAQATLTGAVQGHKLSAVTLTASDTTAATDKGTITPSAAKIVDAAGNDVTANYEITYTAGVLTVADAPTPTPTVEPSVTPTVEPSVTPTVEPSVTPTVEPTATPTVEPTATPTVEPTATVKPPVQPTPRPEPEPDFTVLAKLKATGKRALKLTWTEVKGAKGYDIYFISCGTEWSYGKMDSVSAKKARSYKFTGLEKNTGYKAYVQAYKKVDGQKVYIGDASPVVHAFTGGSAKTKTNAAKVTVKRDAMKLVAGESGQIKATVTGVDPKKDVITHAGLLRYYSTNRNVAKVDGSGNVTAVGAGNCSIYAVATNGVRARVKVSVASAPTKLAFGKSRYSVKVGNSINLMKKLSVTPKTTKTTYTWESSAPKVAKVNKDGVVKALKKGKATITVTAANGKRAKVTIVVK